MTLDLTSATLITLVSMCILPPTPSEAMAVSKQPRRSHLTSELHSVTSITYVTMLLWPLNASSDSLLLGGGGLSSIDLRGFAAGKKPDLGGSVYFAPYVALPSHSGWD